MPASDPKPIPRDASIDWLPLWHQALHDAYIRLSGAADIEDLVQDAFVLLIEQQEPIDNPRAWLRTTVWRLSANRNRTTHPAEELPARGEASHSAPDVELRMDLQAVARRLTPRERYLLGYLLRGLNHREIARELGIGWKSVGSRVQRLRGKLRPYLAADLGIVAHDCSRSNGL